MKQKTIKVEPIALLPTPSGCAVFLSDGKKVILIYIDPSIGSSINMALQKEKSLRPLSHDLFHNVLEAFGAKVMRMIIVKADGDVFFARLFLQVENEMMERKIVEIDSRPSDALALSVRDSAPIYVLENVWLAQNDVSGLLEDMKNSQTSSDDENNSDFDFDDTPF